jgi:hypothetical protein
MRVPQRRAAATKTGINRGLRGWRGYSSYPRHPRNPRLKPTIVKAVQTLGRSKAVIDRVLGRRGGVFWPQRAGKAGVVPPLIRREKIQNFPLQRFARFAFFLA